MAAGPLARSAATSRSTRFFLSSVSLSGRFSGNPTSAAVAPSYLNFTPTGSFFTRDRSARASGSTGSSCTPSFARHFASSIRRLLDGFSTDLAKTLKRRTLREFFLVVYRRIGFTRIPTAFPTIGDARSSTASACSRRSPSSLRTSAPLKCRVESHGFLVFSVAPMFLLGFAVLSVFYWHHAVLFSKSARELRRLDSVSKSPLYSICELIARSIPA